MEKESKSDRPSLGILIYSLSGGGAERFTSYLAPYLADRGITVKLFLMNTTITFDIPEYVSVHYLEKSQPSENGLFKLLKIPYLAYKYAKLAKKEKLTHSFSLLTRPNYINVLSRRWYGNKAKIIIGERSFPSLQYGLNDFRSRMNKKLIPILFPKADLVICNSNRTVTDLSQNFKIPLHKITVIHNPIDIKKISEIDGVNPDFYDKKHFNLVTIGRLVPGKNHVMLIQAVKKIKNVRLYIIGDGPLRNDLENIITENNLENQIFLLGFDSNPYQYLKGADLFIFGSKYEGFPNVLLEAMACRLPLLTTNCKSGPNEIMELQEESENSLMITKYGILVPVDNLDLTIKAIDYFLKNSDYVITCREQVQRRVLDFELDTILNKYQIMLLG